MKSDKLSPEKLAKTDRQKIQDNELRVELQNSIEFTEKVKQEVHSQIQKYQNGNKDGLRTT